MILVIIEQKAWCGSKGGSAPFEAPNVYFSAKCASFGL